MKWITLVACVAVTSNVFAVDRTVSDIHITLDEWELVPTMIGTQVESFLCLRDETTVIGSNITSIWFLRISDDQWQAYAWNDPDVVKSIAHVKSTLQLDDSTDMNWPNAEAQQGVNPLLAVEPEAFGTGVFQGDSFSEVIESLADPGPFVELLISAGWSAADIAIQTGNTDCTQNELLSTLAALVEADIYMDAGGAHVADFSIPDMICKEWMSVSSVLDSEGAWSTVDFSASLEAISSIDPLFAWQNISEGTEFSGVQTLVIDAGSFSGESQPEVTNHFVVTLKDVTPPIIELDIAANSVVYISPSSFHPYYVTPASITVTASATDAVDTNLLINIFHNNEPITNGSLINEVGFHSITVQAIDSTGNESWINERFEIRKRMDYSASIYVANIETVDSIDGIEQLLVTVRLTSEEFDVWTTNISTLNLWLTDEDGTWIRATGDTPVSSQYEDFAYELTFVADFSTDPLSVLPSEFVMTGRGTTDTSIDYDLFSRTAAVIDLEPFVSPGQDNRSTPIGPGQGECEWRVLELPFTDHTSTIHSEWPGGYGDLLLEVFQTQVHGIANLYDFHSVNQLPQSLSESHAESSSIVVFLDGDNCCKECNIFVLAAAQIRGNGHYSEAGSVHVGGLLEVKVDSTSAHASGSLTFGSSGIPGIKVENGDVTAIPVGTKSAIFDAQSSPGISQNWERCSLSIRFKTQGEIDITLNEPGGIQWMSLSSVGANIFNWSTINLDVEASDGCGQGLHFER